MVKALWIKCLIMQHNNSLPDTILSVLSVTVCNWIWTVFAITVFEFHIWNLSKTIQINCYPRKCAPIQIQPKTAHNDTHRHTDAHTLYYFLLFPTSMLCLTHVTYPLINHIVVCFSSFYLNSCFRHTMLYYIPIWNKQVPRCIQYQRSVLLFQRLTHWGRDKMDAISQTPFSRAFSWMKMFKFR